MSHQNNVASKLYAILIGIDYYLPNVLSDGSSYKSLTGCVRDITAVEKFLKKVLSLPNEYIFKLQASNSGAKEIPEPSDQWPTYENMVRAFRTVTEIAQKGDLVYIHYSGHGGRTRPTKLPELKGENGYDEALVPMDIGLPTSRYLRDVEMADLLKTMVDKGLIVTIVLDCCYSGGATRGASGDAVRSVATIDTIVRPMESLVATNEKLAQTWRGLSGGGTRNLMLGYGWSLEGMNYVLLAACQPSESAYEHYFDGVGKHGVLTYWLLDTLKQLRPNLTYKQLHDRLLAKVHSEFVHQTPLLQGDGSRVVLGSKPIQLQYAVNVINVNLAQKRLLLNTGQVQGIDKGAQFVIYAPDQTDLTQVNERQALVEITNLGETTSWANILTQFRSDIIQQGAQAVLVDLGAVRLRRNVRLVSRPELSTTIPISEQEQSLKRVELAIHQFSQGFVALAGSSDTTDYQVVITETATYEIWDSTGLPIPHLRPPLSLDESQAANQVARRLTHLTRYRNIAQFDNTDALSLLTDRLVVELLGKYTKDGTGQKSALQPFDNRGNMVILKPGEWTSLRIKNASSHVLNITILDLAPDWSITQIYPSPQDSPFMPFDPGHEEVLELQAYLSDGYTEATDTLKVFAMRGTANFRWLELPALDQPYVSKGTRDAHLNPLDRLLAELVTEESQIRQVELVPYSTKEWVTAQVEIKVQLT